MSGKIVTSLHTHLIELVGGKSLTLRILDNGMVDVTVELSETECYGVEVSKRLFLHSMAQFLSVLDEESFFPLDNSPPRVVN